MTSRSSAFGQRRPLAALAVAASLLMTTACSDGGSPPGGPPVSESASASASATATSTVAPTPTPSYKPADATGKAQNVPVPVLPEVARTETKEGLEAFARYWFSQLNFAYETGRLEGLDSVTAANCEFCTKLTRALATNYESDRWMAGGHIETPSISTTYTAQAGGDYQVIVQVQQASITYYRPDGTEFRTPTPPSDTGNVMLAAYTNGQWHLTGLHPIR